MANADRPSGLRPYGEAKEVIEVTAGGIVYPGDAVKREADGDVVVVTAGDDVFGIALSYASADGEKILLSVDPNQKYIVQADGADVAADTELGLNADILATGGNSSYKLSRMELDSSTITSASSAQLNILEIRKADDNAYGANVDCIVQINEHQIIGENDSSGV